MKNHPRMLELFSELFVKKKGTPIYKDEGVSAKKQNIRQWLVYNFDDSKQFVYKSVV